ncbi:MAG: hypothetical protein ACI9JM_000987 [Halioglobus sp.]|jgi:hypothetical protein
MYRYSVDNAVTYTPDDLALFRESPFAVWMERLTLENPDHGIPPDVNTAAPLDSAEPQDEIVETLRAEGRNVVLIDWEMEEPERRAATVAAMRSGADFIVNAVLAMGPLCGTANLLMRTSGFSELGDFLYVPCDTQAKSTLQAAFRLSFLADLLHHLQGQLPPQILIIGDDADVVPLQTEDHIHYYRAVKDRCSSEILDFRKHRMPDPAESSHFGRWSECASEVLKQRVLSEEAQEEAKIDAAEAVEDDTLLEAQEPEHLPEEEPVAMPAQQVASMGGAAQPTYDLDAHQREAEAAPVTSQATAIGQTLAEQARSLSPDSFQAGSGPGHTPNIAKFGKRRTMSVVNAEVEKPLRASDVALQNLEFIGSGPEIPFADAEPPTEPCAQLSATNAPPPSLKEVVSAQQTQSEMAAAIAAEIAAETAAMNAAAISMPASASANVEHDSLQESLDYREPFPDLEPPQPALLPPEADLPDGIVEKGLVEKGLVEKGLVEKGLVEKGLAEEASAAIHETVAERKPHPLDSEGFSVTARSMVDSDKAPTPSLMPVTSALLNAEGDQPWPTPSAAEEFLRRRKDLPSDFLDRDEAGPAPRSFSNSLSTNNSLDKP